MRQQNSRLSRCSLFLLTGIFLSVGVEYAQAGSRGVIPLFSVKGDAKRSDVIKGQTYSSNEGKNLVGTLEIYPAVQTVVDDYGMRFNLLPAGTFTMGSPDGEPGAGSDEPAHQVTLTTSFYIQQTEVTQKQWRDVVKAAVWEGYLPADELNESPSQPALGEEYPVNNVSWNDVVKWIDALNRLTGGTYDLPTEAQWEYAARGGTSTAWGCGDRCDDSAAGIVEDSSFNSNADMMGWYNWHNSWASGYTLDAARPVARKQPNDWGLFDLHGNVAEWCRDLYGDYRFKEETDPQGASSGTSRVVRGGHFQSPAGDTRAAARGQADPTTTNSSTGFRLVFLPGN